MKVEAEVWKIENGIIRQVRIGEFIYSLVSRRRGRPRGSGLYQSETYNVWITQDDVDTVTSIIMELGGRFDIKSLLSRCKLSNARIRTVIEYLINQGRVKRVDGGRYILI